MQRAPLVLGAVAALVGLAIAVVLYRGYGGGGAAVGFGPRGYTVTSDERVRIEFEVDKDPAATALCTVRARARTGDEAGNALVRVGPSPRREVVVSYDLVTNARAVTGEVTGCSLDRGSSPAASP